MISLLMAMLDAPFEREVKFPGADGFELVGTLALPAGVGKAPGVVLIAGSGPTDRDGNSPQFGMVTDLHKQIAAKLAAEGVASLRFDKRAIHHYAAKWPKSVSEIDAFMDFSKFVGDAEGAMACLRAQPEVDPARVGIVGHSEGGLIALQIAHDWTGKPEAPKAIALLSTAGRPLGVVIQEQLSYRLPASLVGEAKRKALLDYAQSACQALKDGKPLPSNPPAELKGLFNPAATHLMAAYCRIDPAELAPSYPGPVFAANGTDDTQVSAERDLAALQKAFESRPAGFFEAMKVTHASHNMKDASSNPDAFAGPVQPGLLNHLAAFLKNNL